MAIGQGFHGKPSPNLGSLPAGLKWIGYDELTWEPEAKVLNESGQPILPPKRFWPPREVGNRRVSRNVVTMETNAIGWPL